jgi:DNA-binding transcriptional LysR family regulator
MLPDYLLGEGSELLAILRDYEVPSFDVFFVYPEEMRDSARVTAFRDFLVANARRWHY